MGATDKLTTDEAKARRKRNLLIALAVVLAIPTTAIIVVNHVDSTVPPPLWTRDEAFPIPPKADNGWPAIKHYDSITISGIDLAPIDKLLAASKSNKLPELGRLFRPARVVASKVTQHTEICQQAFDQKRMVIGCFSIEPRACPTEGLDICSRLVSFAALDEAARGSRRGAERMTRVLQQLTDASANSPHPWVQARALVMLKRAIHHTSVIIKWKRTDDRPLREALEAIDEKSLPQQNLVIGNYLLKQLALQQALEKTDTWLLDEGDIMRGLNAPYQQAKSGGELPPPPSYKQGLFWWFDNPVGKKMLDAVRPGADEDFIETKELHETVMKRRNEALKLE